MEEKNPPQLRALFVLANFCTSFVARKEFRGIKAAFIACAKIQVDG